MPRSRCSAEDFVRAWLASTSIKEVAQRTGYAATTVPIMAMRMRKAGVRLPRMRGTGLGTLDLKRLNGLIDEDAEARRADRKR